MENIDYEKLEPIIEKYKDRSGRLIPVLNEVQREIGFLSMEVQEYIADNLKIPLSKVYGVVTFYAQFSLEPKGKYVINACDGTACHVRGSRAVIETIKDEINLEEGERTTDDGLFTLEVVSCIGACGLAPVITINEKVHGKMTPDKVKDVIANLEGREDE